MPMDTSILVCIQPHIYKELHKGEINTSLFACHIEVTVVWCSEHMCQVLLPPALEHCCYGSYWFVMCIDIQIICFTECIVVTSGYLLYIVVTCVICCLLTISSDIFHQNIILG